MVFNVESNSHYNILQLLQTIFGQRHEILHCSRCTVTKPFIVQTFIARSPPLMVSSLPPSDQRGVNK